MITVLETYEERLKKQYLTDLLLDIGKCSNDWYITSVHPILKIGNNEHALDCSLELILQFEMRWNLYIFVQACTCYFVDTCPNITEYSGCMTKDNIVSRKQIKAEFVWLSACFSLLLYSFSYANYCLCLTLAQPT